MISPNTPLGGASSSPVFSPDGKSVAFLEMKEADFESDKNRIILVPEILQPETLIELLPLKIAVDIGSKP
jgi:hypothetical protein